MYNTKVCFKRRKANKKNKRIIAKNKWELEINVGH